jgi:hypothetical protein
MPDKPRGPTFPENFVVNHTVSNYAVNFVVNPLEPLRSIDGVLAGTTDRGHPDGR